MKAAVIGIGSNSVRMLLAEIANGQGRRLMRDREGTRLFAGLDAQGRLSGESMTQTAAAVRRMALSAREQGAEEIRLFATSATRDAANQGEFAALLRQETGLELEICTGAQEASLSFLGATDGDYCGVVDIGGGSTEVVVGQGARIDCAFSCQMGAVRLYQRMPIASSADVPGVCALARSILEEELARYPDLRLPEKWIGVGGTFTTLAAMVKEIPWTERTYMHGTLLTRQAAQAWATRLADMPLAGTFAPAGVAAAPGGHCGTRHLHPAQRDGAAGDTNHSRKRIRQPGRLHEAPLWPAWGNRPGLRALAAGPVFMIRLQTQGRKNRILPCFTGPSCSIIGEVTDSLLSQIGET